MGDTPEKVEKQRFHTPRPQLPGVLFREQTSAVVSALACGNVSWLPQRHPKSCSLQRAARHLLASRCKGRES